MVKRAFDVIVSLTALLILSPLLLGIAILIKISSPGPVIYSQVRIGRYEKPFKIHKFRTMVVNADRLGSSVTTRRDPRITFVGHVLRRTKLDELPQLWNVLVGDMSLVGPRPDVPDIVAVYTPEMRRIFTVRPGITSNAALHLRNEEELLALASDPEDAYLQVVVPAKVRIAMEHVENQSLLFDLKIIGQTIWALTLGRLIPSPAHPLVLQIGSAIMKMNTEQSIM